MRSAIVLSFSCLTASLLCGCSGPASTSTPPPASPIPVSEKPPVVPVKPPIKPPTPTRPAETAKAPEATEVTAGEMAQAWDKDPEGARLRYDMLKPLIVTGVVKSVDVGDDGEVTIVLKGHEEGAEVMYNSFKDSKSVKDGEGGAKSPGRGQGVWPSVRVAVFGRPLPTIAVSLAARGNRG